MAEPGQGSGCPAVSPDVSSLARLGLVPISPKYNWTRSCIDLARPPRGHDLRVLFVTTEMDDFVRVGGLAAVSAALPRALRALSDVRIMLPGYADLVEQLTHVQIVGECPQLAEMPACK